MGIVRITLAGQDITANVNLTTLDIKDTLGQGAGNGAAVSGRTAQCEFMCNLGPLYTAVGAGTIVSTPTLVRMGELLIYDQNNFCMFGGYASKFEDHTGRSPGQGYRTKVYGYDYWQHLDRVFINEVYDGYTDIQAITALCSKYASWINLSAMPTTSAYLFGPQLLRNMSLQKAIQKIADTTGFQVWITPDKVLHYVPPQQAANAPFSLSETPDFVTKFSFTVTKQDSDETSAINRVYFYGGKVPSANFTQDLSAFANGNNTTFPLAYYPRKADDGKIHVNVNNGPDLVVGSATGTNNAQNTLKPTGLCDVLINYDAHTLTFAYAPASGARVTCTYRYEYPLVVVVTDQSSYQFWGMYLDGAISDNTVYDRQQAGQRCKILLTEQSRGLRTLQVLCWKGGLQAGQILRVDHNTRNIHDSFVIQEVHTFLRPNGGALVYEITLGAWNWNIVDVLKSAVHFSTAQDTNTDENETPLYVSEEYENLKVTFSMSIVATHQTGVFYARSAAVGDGHDAYPGFFSVTS